MKKFYFIIYGLVVITTLNAQSDRVSGKIRGRVIDSTSKDPLVGANVFVLPVESGRGTMTNQNGEFVLPNLMTGRYNIKVSYMGYASTTIQDIDVSPGGTSEILFSLTVEAIEGQEVNVIAETMENIIDIKTVVTQVKYSGEQLYKMPVSNFTDVIANAGGVVKTEAGRSRGIHMRGGRSGEVAFYVDGILTNDPVDRSQGVQIDKEAIDVLTISKGGFSAEFGEAMSGIVTVITKSGSKQDISGNLIIETDQLASNNSNYNNNYGKYNLQIGGPFPGLKNYLSFYLSGSYVGSDITSPRSIKLPHSTYTHPMGTFKLTFSPPHSGLNAVISASYEDKAAENYSHGISKGDWLRDYYKTFEGSRRFSLQIQNTLGKNTAWRLMLSTFEHHTNYGSGENISYKDFHYLSTRLDWVDYAMDNGWYDPSTRKWKELTDNNGLPLISDNYFVIDDLSGGTENSPIQMSSLTFEEQAFYYYYYTQGNQFDFATGKWSSEAKKVVAYNQRWHEAGSWYIPAYLDQESNYYDAVDTTAYFKEFDEDEYASYLFGDDDFQRSHDLWSYLGNMHNGYYYDRDIFNVYTYGPGRPRSHKSISSHSSIEFQMNTQWTIRNAAKFGFKATASTMDYRDIQFANQNPYFDSYYYEPLSGSAYAENTFENNDFILMTGLRWDYFDPNVQSLKTSLLVEEGVVERQPADIKLKLSPRLGINFNASDKTAIYTNYGYFVQFPQYSEMYQNVYADISSGLPLVGNPNITPEETIQYQFGLAHRFSESLSLEIVSFFKDQMNLATNRTYPVLIDGQVATVTVMEMEDYAKIKGIEFKLKLNNFSNLTGDIDYTWMSAKGTGSSNREYYYLYIFDSDRPLPVKEYPMEFDITHSVKFNLNYYLPKKNNSSFTGNFFSDWNFNFQGNLSSGAPYTPTDIYGKAQEIGSKRMPGYKSLDMRVEKYFNKFSAYFDIRNLFNWINTTYVYSYSGEPDTNGRPPVFERSRYTQYIGDTNPITGNLISSAEEAYDSHLTLWKSLLNNPYNYSSARYFHFGINLWF
jgi:outer membrane receptor protein involved in Fe transport